MADIHTPLCPKQTLCYLSLPLLATFVCLRLYLHLVHVRHAYPGGYLVHHLFIGALIVLPASYLLAFGVHSRSLAILVRVSLGIGSGLILDELTYLVATQASDADYVSRLSLSGAAVFVSSALIFLLVLYRLHRCD